MISFISLKKIFVFGSGLLVGVLLGYLFIVSNSDVSYSFQKIKANLPNDLFSQRQVIGFLPFWLLDRAQVDYSKYLTTLTYFGLTIGPDGKILKLTQPQETEPGWNVLKSGKLDPFLASAKGHHLELSLLMFASDSDSINQLLTNPVQNADNLVFDVTPILGQYGFSDLNLDIEDTSLASPSAQNQLAQFVGEVKKGLGHSTSLTLEVSPDDLIKPKLINISQLSDKVDYIVLMAYDYHYLGSQVTGPIAPLLGAGTTYEYDTEVAVGLLSRQVPSRKIILGVPVYGYEWETLEESSHSATIPGTGGIASNSRVENLLANCATCSATYDAQTQESYLSYPDLTLGDFHQIYFPTKASTTAKINLVNTNSLGGLAVWALGYEGKNILDPLIEYK